MKAILFLLIFGGNPVVGETGNTICIRQELLTLRVSEKRVDCDGLNGRTQCYQVQKGAAIGTADWETIPGDIENFRYEEGYRFDLSVEMTMNPNASDEKSRYSYRLREVLSKTRI